MKNRIALLLITIILLNGVSVYSQNETSNNAMVTEALVFEEVGGIVAVEAEYFFKQERTDIRKWYRTSKNEQPEVGRDEDSTHIDGASNNAYLEILPDTRVTHSDKLVPGENFSNEPGTIGILSYNVKINTPGRYYVWVRAFSSGGEDNGLHVGMDGEWPEHGQRMQWCTGKHRWTWGSRQRTQEVHCGVPNEIYLDIEAAGTHVIQFSMREDGFEFDKFILTNDRDYVPKEEGPSATMKLPEQSYFQTLARSHAENKVLAIDDFQIEGTGFYKDNGGKWFAINPNQHKEAQTTAVFNFENARYDVVFVGVGENDGQSKFTILINKKVIGFYAPPLTQKTFEEGKDFNAVWENIKLKKGDEITVISEIGSADGKEWARGRWAGIIFAPVGKGKEVIKK